MFGLGNFTNFDIDPIKSCGGYKIPAGIQWGIKPHGLAWDREWCLVHLGTGSALNQKQYVCLDNRGVIDADNESDIIKWHWFALLSIWKLGCST